MSPVVLAFGALALAIVSEVAGSTCLQLSQQFSKLVPTVAMVVLYGASFFFLSHALKAIPLGVAYAIWAGLGIVLTALVGVFVFRQVLDLAAVGGIGLIIAGVLVMNLFSKTTGH